MSLRLRLILVLIGLVGFGLIVSDVVTSTALRNSLINRMDKQLQLAAVPYGDTLFGALSSKDRQFRLNGSQVATPSKDAPSQRATPTQYFVHPDLQSGLGTNTRPVLEIPPGAIEEIRGPRGQLTASIYFVFEAKTRLRLNLPARLPGSGLSTSKDLYFSAMTLGRHPVSYVALAKPLLRHLGVYVLAIPTAGMSETLAQLREIELVVFGFVLFGLAVIAWWMIRRDLRPLENITETASAIAQGDLSLRVSLDEHGVEVERLGTAFNLMVSGIEHAFAEKEVSEERLRRFLAEASHELRTPLTSIMGYSEIFAMGLVSSPEDLGLALAHIRDDALRMNRLVDDLFVLAQLDQTPHLQLEAVEMGPLVERSVESFRLTGDDARINIFPESHAVVLGDTDRLRQMVDNLINNALVHSPSDAAIEVSVSDGPNNISLVVHDNGPGIRRGEEELRFQPFFRSDQSRSRHSGGAGLGLTIVQSVVEAHGGTIAVIPGSGATFVVKLPIHKLQNIQDFGDIPQAMS